MPSNLLYRSHCLPTCFLISQPLFALLVKQKLNSLVFCFILRINYFCRNQSIVFTCSRPILSLCFSSIKPSHYLYFKFCLCSQFYVFVEFYFQFLISYFIFLYYFSWSWLTLFPLSIIIYLIFIVVLLLMQLNFDALTQIDYF